MQVTVTTLSDEVFTIEVREDLELENFKALCEFETGIPAREIALLWNGRPLHDGKMTLKAYGIKDGDMLLLQHMKGVQGHQPGGAGGKRPPNPRPGGGGSGGIPTIDFSGIQIPGIPRSAPMQSTSEGSSNQGSFLLDDPKFIRDMLISNPHEMSLLKERNPPLSEALLSGSLEKFTEVFRKQQNEKMEKEQERVRLMTADPFNPDVQKVIAEEIRLKNVESNMETAMEYAPESFGQVIMLYIDCSVNGHHVKAFVDSGAQMTIMSQACAERCNIMRLVDTRWAGIAKGVGTQKIIGRVHLGQIQIGPDFLQSSFSILEDQPMDMLLGLDMLKRHQCSIDLKRNVLRIGTTGTETPFLSESDLPEHARLNLLQNAASIDQEDRQLAEALAQSAEDAAKKNAGNFNKRNLDQPMHSDPVTAGQLFSEEAVSRLVSHGFSRQSVLEELRKANGDADQALAALFAKSLKMP